jgi:hypothetical protein
MFNAFTSRHGFCAQPFSLQNNQLLKVRQEAYLHNYFFCSFCRYVVARICWYHFVTLVVCLLVNIHPLLQAQQQQQEELEEILEFLAQSSSIVPQLDDIEFYTQHPLPLSTTPAQELSRIFGIPLPLARQIRAFARTFRPSSLVPSDFVDTAYPEYSAMERLLGLHPAYTALLRRCTAFDSSQITSSPPSSATASAPKTPSTKSANSSRSAQGAPTKTTQDSLRHLHRSHTGNTSHQRSHKRYQARQSELRYRARTFTYLHLPRGLTNGAFQGDRWSVYQRLSYRYAPFEASFTTQKDVGERSLFDFMTGFAAITLPLQTSSNPVQEATNTPRHLSYLKIIAGDFLVQSGMGSILWRAFGARKGADVVAPAAQYGNGIEPYRSVLEQQFFRGIAAEGLIALSATSSLKAFSWVSSSARSATIDTTANTATSLDADGYFRTQSEIARRNTLLERSAGLGVELRWHLQRHTPEVQTTAQTNTQTNEARIKPTSSLPSSRLQAEIEPSFSLGTTVFALDYDRPITSRAVSSFFGKSGVLSQLYGSISTGSSFLAGELNRDANGHWGGRLGLQTQVAGMDLAAAFRTFDAAFRSPFGYNFGENSRPVNERGLYFGVAIKPHTSLRIASYLDVYSTLEPTSTVPEPVRGIDLFSEARWEASRHSTLLLRASIEQKTDAVTLRDGRVSTRIAFARTRATLRTEWFFTPPSTAARWLDGIRFRARLEGVRVDFSSVKPEEFGWLGFAELGWKPAQTLQILARCTAYSTASFDSALWQFEPHVAGVLANTAVFGSGLRYLAVCSWQPSDWLFVWLRGEATIRYGAQSMGSGQLEIPGNTDTRITAQVECRF